MDKSEEVKRFESKIEYSDRPTGGGNPSIVKAWMRETEKGNWVMFTDHAKALSAERAQSHLLADRVGELESQLTAANAKIVELEAYATKLYADLTNEVMNKDMALSTANKKAEKLVGLVESLSLLKHYRHKLDEKCTALCEWADEAKQAIKEFKGEK